MLSSKPWLHSMHEPLCELILLRTRQAEPVSIGSVIAQAVLTSWQQATQAATSGKEQHVSWSETHAARLSPSSTGIQNGAHAQPYLAVSAEDIDGLDCVPRIQKTLLQPYTAR